MIQTLRALLILVFLVGGQAHALSTPESGMDLSTLAELNQEVGKIKGEIPLETYQNIENLILSNPIKTKIASEELEYGPHLLQVEPNLKTIEAFHGVLYHHFRIVYAFIEVQTKPAFLTGSRRDLPYIITSLNMISGASEKLGYHQAVPANLQTLADHLGLSYEDALKLGRSFTIFLRGLFYTAALEHEYVYKAQGDKDLRIQSLRRYDSQIFNYSFATANDFYFSGVFDRFTQIRGGHLQTSF